MYSAMSSDKDPPAASKIWEVEFEPAWGGPGKISLDSLLSWHEFPDSGVQYYSGRAVYRNTLRVDSASPLPEGEVMLDLGRVEVAAEVKINGKPAGIVWRPPYQVSIGRLLTPGENTLEIAVVNLWINRQIGDEFLPEDSDRNANGTLKAWPDWLAKGQPSPAGRRTFTSWRLWKKGRSPATFRIVGTRHDPPRRRCSARPGWRKNPCKVMSPRIEGFSFALQT